VAATNHRRFEEVAAADPVDLNEAPLEELEEDEEEPEDDLALGDEEERDESSLDPHEESDIMAFASAARSSVGESRTTRAAPVRSRQEFVCNRCRLVKPRLQLGDAERGLCSDCI
jgi:hypothetical protein